MKDYFSIGEISTLLGLSSHTLRYYDKIGLLHPAEINEKTGYRYYAYYQLFTLERIRHLQLLGFTLDEISDIISDVSTDTLLSLLERREQQLSQKMERLSTLRDTVNHYLTYYRRAGDGICSGIPFKEHFPERYLLAEPYLPGEPVCGTAGYRLMVRKSQPDCAQLDFLRQIGFFLDVGALLSGRVIPTHYYMFLEKPPAKAISGVQTISEGDYLCYRCLALNPKTDVPVFSKFLADTVHPRLIMAMEYEQSLDDSVDAFSQSLFEIQIPL